MGKCLSYCENTIRWGFKGKGKMMKKVGVEGINEGWSGGLLSLRGGGGIKFGLRFTKGRKILDFCCFSSFFRRIFRFMLDGKKGI